MIISQIEQLLLRTIPKSIPVLLTGSPGVGKSQVIEGVAKKLDMECLVINPALMDPTDIGGIPMLNKDGVYERMVDVYLDNLRSPDCPPTVLFIDELGQSSGSMQSAIAPLIHDRRMAGKFLSPNVHIVLASNKKSDRAGVGAFLSHLISRLVIINVDVDLEEWRQWAFNNEINEFVIGFIGFETGLLSPWNEATINKASIGDPYPCPRSWAKVSEVLKLNLSHNVEYEAIKGCVGEGAARSFTTFLASAKKMPIDELMEENEMFEWPKEFSERHALCTSLAYRVRKYPEYVIRAAIDASNKNMSEYGILIIQDAKRIWPEIIFTSHWRMIYNSPLESYVKEANSGGSLKIIK